MHLFCLILCAVATLIRMSSAEQPDYISQLNTLAQGGADACGNSSGSVWLNVTNFAPDKMPYIQHDLGIYTYDSFDNLKTIADTAFNAASGLKYGDLAYLFTAFAMGGYGPFINVSSKELQQGLLETVTPHGSTVPDQELIELYANTSSISSIRDAFASLKPLTANRRRSIIPVTQRATEESQPTCSKRHGALVSSCEALISTIINNISIHSGGPRSICRWGCCISWSANATFHVEDLYNASSYCVNVCGTAELVSCEVRLVNLEGQIVNQCLSNRANGCE